MKFVRLQFSWVKKLYDDCFHEGKIKPLHLLWKYFGPHFKFYKKLVGYQYGIYPLRYFLSILSFSCCLKQAHLGKTFGTFLRSYRSWNYNALVLQFHGQIKAVIMGGDTAMLATVKLNHCSKNFIEKLRKSRLYWFIGIMKQLLGKAIVCVISYISPTESRN